MAQLPAVVIIARHGARLDAADQSWHLSTPTPYDPPLTYGGWNQCRSLGARIASLLHERELQGQSATEMDGVRSFDFASVNGNGKRSDVHVSAGNVPRKRTKRRHKVVIHSSPFLRCLQTSVAIAAGMAQYAPVIEMVSSQKASLDRSNLLSSAKSINPLDNKKGLAHSLGRRTASENHRSRKAKIRVDAFLGEWLNPGYFENILPPPPSAMMVATAKAELMENDIVEVFVPSTVTRPSGGNLWGGGANAPRASALDDWSHIQEQLPPRKRDRASTQSSVGSAGSASGRKTHSRSTSTVPKAELTRYVPPIPHYAISSSDFIPRGYVAHAKSACTNVDYQWDSSRAPLLWGDGGEYGEEWSAMHKRFRRGMNHMIQWYSRHNADDRSEDALGLDQAERHVEEEDEDLVVILVTHGAGCNALIGALTAQPVLLDVGMASLTMAVRKEDGASTTSPTPSSLSQKLAEAKDAPDQTLPDEQAKRGNLDLDLSGLYDLNIVASSEHLRPKTSAGQVASPSTTAVPKTTRDSGNESHLFNGTTNTTSHRSVWSAAATGRSNTSTALGSIRRPSTANPTLRAPFAGPGSRSNSIAIGEVNSQPSTPGLWTPPTARTPNLQSQAVPPGADRTMSPGPALSGASGAPEKSRATIDVDAVATLLDQTDSGLEEYAGSGDEDVVNELPRASEMVPQPLSRGLSQKELWGTGPSGDRVHRKARGTPKRRWTVNDEK